ncbi:MAG TPA: hypothetical protein VKU80_12315 [Planctomycetota bacterium]|nr:hypothetical protein [Planctomycetota bacterium]
MADSKRSQAARKAARTKGPRRMAEAGLKALSHFATTTVGHEAMARQGRGAARTRSSADRSAAARRGIRTKGSVARHSAAVKAARSRKKSSS